MQQNKAQNTFAFSIAGLESELTFPKEIDDVVSEIESGLEFKFEFTSTFLVTGHEGDQ
jgi:hypothetical protein